MNMYGLHPPRLFIVTTDADASDKAASDKSTSQSDITTNSVLNDLMAFKKQLEAEVSGNGTKSNDEEDRTVYRLGRANVENRKESYFLTVDLPGVKAADLKIEETNGKLHIEAERTQGNAKHLKYVQSFAFDTRITDFAKANAVLQHGVLSMTIPKKEREVPKAYNLSINTSDPSTDQDDSNKKHAIFTLDLPGVKASDLKAEVTDKCVLHLHAKRKDQQGKVLSEVERYLPLNEKLVDISALEAFLQDGVLTVMAPCHASSASRTIQVSTDTGAESTDKPQISATSESSNNQNSSTEKAANTDDKKLSSEESSSEPKETKETKSEKEVVVETAKDDDD